LADCRGGVVRHERRAAKEKGSIPRLDSLDFVDILRGMHIFIDPEMLAEMNR